MDLSASSREDPFAAETFFSKQDLPVVPNDNPETYCRLCLTTPEVEPLFPVNGEPNVYVMELIGKYIGIGLTIQDDYPCAVCRSCHLILDQFDLFRQNCLKVDIAIRRRRLGLDLPPVEVKSEVQDDEDNEEEMPYIRVERNHYQCRFCAETFRSLAMFLTHCKEDHPEESRMFKCKQCNKAFMTKTARLQHIRSHQPNNGENDLTGDRVQVCEKCMVTFDSYKLLKIHLKENHSNDPKQDTLVCGTCSKQFSRITILRNHILRVHLGKLPHVCKQCGVSFGYTQQLVTHLKDQHGIIVDQLNQSGQSSNAEDDLDPTDELPYIPVVPQTPDLHESQPPPPEDQPLNRNHYTCSECSAQCNSQEDLRTHRKLHQDPTWWKCTHCRNFVKHQKMHLMKKHPTIDPEHADSSFLLRYRCWLCRVYFKSLQQMEQHVAARHGVILPPSLASSLAAAGIGDGGEGSIPLDDDGDDEEGGGAGGPGEESTGAGAMMPPPAPPAPLPLTVQPPGLPFLPEHLPLLLSQMENGAWDYLREMTRLMDPANLAAFAAAMKIKTEMPEPMATASRAEEDDDGVVDLSTNSTTSMSSTHASDDTLLEQDDEQDSSEEEHNYIRLDNRLYQCRFCSETFRHLLLIRKHTKAAHPTEWKSFKCPHCKRRFPSAAIRDRHAHFHTLQHQFVCGSCDQMYDSKKRLEQHVAAVHDPSSANYTAERLRCGACRLSFTEKKYFDMHLKIYHQRKPQRLKNLTDRLQVCERCVTTFESREALQEHVRQVHKTDQPLRSCECPKCGKDLKTTTLLRTHILVVHLGHLPFVCQHCEAAFSTRHWLLKHIEKDHAEATVASTALEGTDFIVISQPTAQPPPPTTMIEAKPSASAVSEESTLPVQQVPIKCTGCDEYFDDSDKLSVHVTLVHAAVPPKIIIDPESGQSMMACGKCEKQYTSRDELEKHVLKAHPTFMLLYKCPLCVKPIRYRKQHMRVHHDTEYDPKEHHYQTRYKCHCCSKLFKSKRNLTSHQNTLLFQCDKCHMRFKTKKSFQSHAAIHRANKSMLKCSDCGLEFGYRARLEEHRNRYHSPNSTEVLKLLNCPYCPRLFISASNRERHVTINHPQSGFLVSCGHCDGMQTSDSAEIRRHYREVHPNERVTFKCAECVNRIYLNFSSYKDHYKAKHAGEGGATGSEQSFSGESSSAAETSFNGGQEGGFVIKQEADMEVEDTKLVQDGVAIKVEPNKEEEAPVSEVSAIVVQEEHKESEEGKAIATVNIVQKEQKEADTMDQKAETSEDAKMPLERSVEPEVLVETKPSETEESLLPTVELTENPDSNCNKIEEPEDVKKDTAIVEEVKEDRPVTEADANQTEESSAKLDDKLEENVTASKERVASTEVKLDEPESNVEKVENESEVLKSTEQKEPVPEIDNKIEEPAPPEIDPVPEVIPPVADVVTPAVESQSITEHDPVASKEEPTEIPPKVRGTTELEAPPTTISDPEPEAPSESKADPVPGNDTEPEAPAESNTEPDSESPKEEIEDQKCVESNEEDGGGEGTAGIAKSAKRARKDEPAISGDGGSSSTSNVEVVDSIPINGLSSPSSEEKEPFDLAEEKTHNLSEVTDEDQPLANRCKRRPKTPTPRFHHTKPAKSQPDKDLEFEASQKVDLKTAVILLPKIQLPDDVLEALPKLDLTAVPMDTEAKLESQKIPEIIPRSVTPVLELVDCLGQFGSKVAPCAISLTRLDDDVFPPVRNYEIPLNKCVVGRSNHQEDPPPVIPRKKPKLAPRFKAVENGHHRRLIPRFLTCKRCGLGGIARTSFSAHRNKCLQLKGCKKTVS